MTFSVKHLLVFLVLVSISFALSRLPAFQSLALVLAGYIVPSFFFLSRNTWRRTVYGGMIGVGIFAMLLQTTVSLKYGPDRHVPEHRYDSGLSEEEMEFKRMTYGFIIPTGFVLGAGIAVVVRKDNSNAAQ